MRRRGLFVATCLVLPEAKSCGDYVLDFTLLLLIFPINVHTVTGNIRAIILVVSVKAVVTMKNYSERNYHGDKVSSSSGKKFVVINHTDVIIPADFTKSGCFN